MKKERLLGKNNRYYVVISLHCGKINPHGKGMAAYKIIIAFQNV